MKESVKKKWIKALRSGEFKQARKRLKTRTGKYCCLGVLTELFCQSKEGRKINAHFNKNGQYRDDTGDVEEILLPQRVIEYAGLEDCNPQINDSALAAMNDNGKTFEDLATIIRKEL